MTLIATLVGSQVTRAAWNEFSFTCFFTFGQVHDIVSLMYREGGAGIELVIPDPASDLAWRLIPPGRPVDGLKARSVAPAARPEAVCPPAPGGVLPPALARSLPSSALHGERGHRAQSAWRGREATGIFPSSSRG